MRQFAQFACIDWSGARVAAPPGIAVGVTDGASAVSLLRPTGGWTRGAILDWLMRHVTAHSNILIGFDLSPALPFLDAGSYFPGHPQAPADPRALWRLVESIASDEPHLTASNFVDHPDYAPYFRRHGDRTGARFGTGIGRLRAVERRQRETGIARSASCFNLVGAAQVGKASLSAMRLFHRLGDTAPFWPFDPMPVSGPVLIEIYTSIAARAAGVPPHRSKIRDQAALDAALAQLGATARPVDGLDEHAADVLVTAAWLRRVAHNPALWTPDHMTRQIAAMEGWTFGVI